MYVFLVDNLLAIRVTIKNKYALYEYLTETQGITDVVKTILLDSGHIYYKYNPYKSSIPDDMSYKSILYNLHIKKSYSYENKIDVNESLDVVALSQETIRTIAFDIFIDTDIDPNKINFNYLQI